MNYRIRAKGPLIEEYLYSVEISYPPFLPTTVLCYSDRDRAHDVMRNITVTANFS